MAWAVLIRLSTKELTSVWYSLPHSRWSAVVSRLVDNEAAPQIGIR